MPSDVRVGSHVVVVEGANRGERGVVNKLERIYDEDTKTTGWRVDIETEGGDILVRVRLAWVRKL